MQFPRALKCFGSLGHDNSHLLSSLQIPHGINVELCGTENEAEKEIVQDEKGAVDGDDLSAVVKKYKKNMEGFEGSKLEIVPQINQFPREELRISGGGGEMELHGNKRFVNGGSSSHKEIHSFSERVRRTEMNQLFAEMSSLLPTSSVKRSKACIVSDIVDYIESLQHQLAIHSIHSGGPHLSVHNAGTRTSLLGNESTPQKEFPSLDMGRHDLMPLSNKNSIDENLSVICKGKDIFITVKSVKKANVLTSLIYAVESHNIHVISGFSSTTDTVAFHCLHAKVADILAQEAKETLFRNLNKLMKSEFRISLKTARRIFKCL